MPDYSQVTYQARGGLTIAYLRDAAQVTAGGATVLRGVQVSANGRPVPLPGRMRDIDMNVVRRVVPVTFHARTGRLVTEGDAARLNAMMPAGVDPGVVFIEVTSERDDLGRTTSWMYWRDDSIPGAPPGIPPVRAQVIFGDERKRAAQLAAGGWRVLSWPSGEAFPVPVADLPPCVLQEAADAQ